MAGNKLYIIGGFTPTACHRVMTNQTWQFDPTAGVGSRWLQRLNLPIARGYVPATTIGGMIYTGGVSDIVDPKPPSSIATNPLSLTQLGIPGTGAIRKHTESDRRDPRGRC